MLAHFSTLGWTLAEETTVGAAGTAFHPDLLLEKDGKRLAVRISEEPLGSFQIGLFGAQCKRAKVKGLVVCESGPDVLEACENARLDFVPSETVGEPIVVPIAKPRPPVTMPLQRPEPEVEPLAPVARPTPLWRWIVVAVIWVAAVIATAYWLTLVF